MAKFKYRVIVYGELEAKSKEHVASFLSNTLSISLNAASGLMRVEYQVADPEGIVIPNSDGMFIPKNK